jgi:hypothetical protein
MRLQQARKTGFIADAHFNLVLDGRNGLHEFPEPGRLENGRAEAEEPGLEMP